MSCFSFHNVIQFLACVTNTAHVTHYSYLLLYFVLQTVLAIDSMSRRAQMINEVQFNWSWFLKPSKQMDDIMLNLMVWNLWILNWMHDIVIRKHETAKRSDEKSCNKKSKAIKISPIDCMEEKATATKWNGCERKRIEKRVVHELK